MSYSKSACDSRDVQFWIGEKCSLQSRCRFFCLGIVETLETDILIKCFPVNAVIPQLAISKLLRSGV